MSSHAGKTTAAAKSTRAALKDEKMLDSLAKIIFAATILFALLAYPQRSYATSTPHEQWAEQQIQREELRAGSRLPRKFVDMRLAWYLAIPAGSRVYPIPGVQVGLDTFYGCELRTQGNTYAITRSGRVVARYPETAKAFFDPVLGREYILPWRPIPKRFAQARMLETVP